MDPFDPEWTTEDIYDDLAQCECGAAVAGRDQFHECADQPIFLPAVVLHCDECLAACLTYGPCQAEAAREWADEQRADGRWT